MVRIGRASPAENVFLNPTLHVFPALKRSCSSLDRCHAPFDFNSPRIFGIGICGTVEACQKFRRQFGTGVDAQSQGIGKDCFSGFGHAFDVTLGFRRPTSDCSRRASDA